MFQLKKITIYLIFIFSTFLANLSQAQTPNCSRCSDDEAFVLAMYGGDQEACIEAECGVAVPVNEYSWMLIPLGFFAVFMMANMNKNKLRLRVGR